MPAICPALVDTQPTTQSAARITWPSAEWRSVLKRQATMATMEAAVRCARVEIDRLQRLNRAIDLDAEDLVQDVLTATCAGTLKWCPEAAPLRTHLRDKVRLACRRLRRRSRLLAGTVRIVLDELRDEDPIWNDVEAALAADVVEPDDSLIGVARRFEAELRVLAAGDEAALRVLDQLAAGTTVNAEVAAATGMSVRTVEGVRKRIQRLARRVSPELLAEIAASL